MVFIFRLMSGKQGSTAALNPFFRTSNQNPQQINPNNTHFNQLTNQINQNNSKQFKSNQNTKSINYLK